MNHSAFLFTLPILLFTSLSVSAAEYPRVIEKLSWLSGCWEERKESKSIEEFWTKPNGQTMLGLSRVIKNGKTVSFEFMRLVETEAGIDFIALPKGQEQASFHLAGPASEELVFENPNHDFPQKIIYRKVSDKEIFARIEGKEKGISRHMDFAYKRVPCD